MLWANKILAGPSWRNRLDRVVRDEAGGMALVLGILLPCLVGVAGIAVDYATFTSQVAHLQKAADAAAIAATSELSVSSADHARIEAIAEAIIRANVPSRDEPITLKITINDDRNGVRIAIAQRKKAVMSRLVTPTLTDISVEAAATMAGRRKLCVLALDPAKSLTIALDAQARITAEGCTVQSNSSDQKGISSKSSARITAQLICSAGGFEGSSVNYAGTRLPDCPTMSDPLASHPPPPVGPCVSSKKLVIESSRTLLPGTYCEGIEIKGSGTRVDLSPGVYVIRDGQLKVDDHAILFGRNVGIYFTGIDANFDFLSSATVNLGAPRDGPMAGILFFGDRQAPETREYKITSGNARTLLGTIYLPQVFLTVDAKNAVADESAYTAIVTRRIELKQSPNLVLNTNYGATDVPVPPGVVEAGAIRLIR